MNFTYCGETTDLTDAEIIGIIKHLRCCDTGEVLDGAIDMLRFQAGCDLAEGHAGPHAGFQVSGRPKPGGGPMLGPETCGWLMWGGAVREIVWPAECPDKGADGLSCLLFDGHEGAHLHYRGERPAPAWLSHECR